MNYEGMLVKSARVYSNDPGGTAVLSLRAFVASPIFVRPRYVSFYGFEKDEPSLPVTVEAGMGKALSLEPGEFSLEGKVTYAIQEVEKGRTYKIFFQAMPGDAGTFRGYLNLKTNFPEKPVLNIKIIGRFIRKNKSGSG